MKSWEELATIFKIFHKMRKTKFDGKVAIQRSDKGYIFLIYFSHTWLKMRLNLKPPVPIPQNKMECLNRKIGVILKFELSCLE